MASLQKIIDISRQLSLLQQAIYVTGLCLASQYVINLLALWQFFPDIAGKSLNGFVKNHTFVIPGILAVCAACFFEGKRGLIYLWRPYTVILFNPFWWIFSACCILPLLLLALHLDDFLYQRGFISYEITLPSWQQIQGQSSKFLRVAISDELFWIGFIYPRLRNSGYSPLKAALPIGLLWGLDYLPFLYTEFFVAPGMNASSLILGWFALTPLYVWIYHKTGSAILIVFFNLCMQFSYAAVPIQPNVTFSNSGFAMANLVSLLFGFLVWKAFPQGQK